MAYCRWSSDNFECDLYCYEDIRGGFTTHVAGSRYEGVVPALDMSLLAGGTKDKEKMKIFLAQQEDRTRFFKSAVLIPIGGPHDGASFNDPTLEAFRASILMLGAAGYRYPDDLIADIDEEIAEAAGGEASQP